MNDLRHHCEDLAEAISLAAAGCLAHDELSELRRQVDRCAGCRARLERLTQLCGALAAARPPADAAETATVQRVLAAVIEQCQGSPAGKVGEKIHRLRPVLSLNTWRWIMRSPVSRVAAAAVFVLAAIGAALWFHDGAAPAFADFIAPILEAKGARFKMTTEMKGPPAVKTVSDVLVLDAARSRQEIEIVIPGGAGTQQPGKSKMVMIVDWGRAKSLTLDPAAKMAMVVSLANLSKEQVAQQDMFGWFRSVLADARDKPEVPREPLGEKVIDGRRVVGFRVNHKGLNVSLWGDPKTGLPVSAEATMALYPGVAFTMSDFAFNVEMDESLFSVEPPAGYAVQSVKVDVSPAGEQDLVAALRKYAELTGGDLPESLQLQPIMLTVGKRVAMKGAFEAVRDSLFTGKEKPSEEQMRKLDELSRMAVDLQSAPGKEKPNEAQIRELVEQMREIAGVDKAVPGPDKRDKEKTRNHMLAQMPKVMERSMKRAAEIQVPIQRGLLFAQLLPGDADAHYAGKGVKLGAADKPIFWYRPKDAKTYRVIHADLSLRQSDAAPDVPNAQRVGTAPAAKR